MGNLAADASGYATSLGTALRTNAFQSFQGADRLLENPTQSPLYASFLSKARTNIGNTYDNAVMNARSTAQSRGFGYASPNEQTTEAGLRGGEASALGGAPNSALAATTPYLMGEAGLISGQGSAELGASESELGMANNDAMMRYQQQQKNKQALYGALAQMAAMGLSFIPGAGPAAAAATSGVTSGTGVGFD